VFELRKIDEVALYSPSAEHELDSGIGSLLGPIAEAQYRYRLSKREETDRKRPWAVFPK